MELSGAMQDAAFAQQQWMVQRNGRFIQISALLYRILEQSDGTRSLDAIARAVSEATKRRVSADNVRYLIEKKLIPLGLVLRSDGTVAEVKEGPRSALAVNMRTMRVDARYIRPPARALRFLYWPPVLLVVLAVALGAQYWVLFEHGVAKAARQILYEPALMLAVIALVIVGTAWHEFGHAAALEYGGGRVRGMGAGLYLIYPAFFTDVTDNYRLGRWARVRTDLGGFYFNLIFTLGCTGLYFLTGLEFFLVVVLLIDLDIIHQCLPFVRLDGYWTLADLTGIPDFFSQIGPFVRSSVPLKRWEGSTLPPLKRWVKVVFSLYIAITVPLLAFLFFMMLKSMPRILATAWSSLVSQVDAFNASMGRGDMVGMTLAGVQAVLLAIPTLGTLYLLVRTARGFIRKVWTWSRPTPARRVAGGLATVAALGLLGYLWAPQLPLGGRPGPLYRDTAAAFRPIAPTERGTVGASARSLPLPFVRSTNEAASSSSSGTHGTRTAPAEQHAAGPQPSVTPTATGAPTPAPVATPTVAPTPTPAPSGSQPTTTPTPPPSPEPGAASGSNGAQATPIVTPTPTPGPTATPSPSPDPTATPTVTPTPPPTPEATQTPSPNSLATPTGSP